MSTQLTIRDLHPSEFDALGQLLVEAYSNLDGFPKPADQPHYYEMLANIGAFTEKPSTRVLVAISPKGHLVGGVVYFGDMLHYGSGGIETSIRGESGIRVLGVDPGIGGLGPARPWPALASSLPKRRATPSHPPHPGNAHRMGPPRLGFARSETWTSHL
jgi:hypothetical protein